MFGKTDLFHVTLEPKDEGWQHFDILDRREMMPKPLVFILLVIAILIAGFLAYTQTQLLL